MSRLRLARRDARRAEAGFTLTELLVAIAIAGIVLTTITLAVAQAFKETTKSSVRLDRSNVADFAARYFAADAAGSAADQSTATPCAGSGTVLTMLQSDGTTVSYAITTNASGTRLVRRACSGPTTTSRQLGRTSGVFHAVAGQTGCPSGSGVTCTLSVAWSDGQGGDFALAGSRRAG